MAQTVTDLFEKARTHERVEVLRAARQQDVMPYFRVLEGQAGPVVEMEGAERVMLGSNNYLGLTQDARVVAAARAALDEYGTALTGSRFLNGTIPLHLELERELREWMGTEDALAFTTGYQANVGCLSTLLAPGDTVICDSGDHASIMDGVAMSRAKLRRGRSSKSLASCGGFIAGPAEVIDFLRIQSRAFMFTAAAVPAAVGAALEAVRICRSPEGPELLARLADNARYLERGLEQLGFTVVHSGATSPDGEEIVTPVVPVLVGDDWTAALFWKALYDGGVYTNVALYPAVERGGALLRPSVIATHEREHLDRALRVFESCRGLLASS